jgi:hypothetical protein
VSTEDELEVVTIRSHTLKLGTTHGTFDDEAKYPITFALTPNASLFLLLLLILLLLV